ncbi:glutamate 5-kinase [Kroppenstedtia eburnea]|uniref:Glutamate 5-kinase n=1 Tax=Kroppenstedtia eburnea TaxID=714067 RepID=A0A1N7IXZ1_9BACL|nr:glutamate 5-kinase [Kroppenstedtia eburnea]QKI82313.1 glutamate 5-kinase [Kroppenstedtia eburnea]SIS41955.1 glutamate 5-kinase [Kroppenstedtia eburnea]
MNHKTVIVKIGTSSLTDDSGKLDPEALQAHVKALTRLKQTGSRVVLVSSGAVAAGFHELGLTHRPRSLAGKQAAAAIGQGHLVQRYREAFSTHGEICAQVLLTRSDFDHRVRFLNALHTLQFLLERGIIPVINENDSVAVDEIRWGDNDILAALVAGLLQADWLLFVTDTDGLYTANPLDHPEAKKVHRIGPVDMSPPVKVDYSKSSLGSGGMRAKLIAARKASRAGIRVYIGTAGESPDWMLDAVKERGSGTYMDPESRRSSRKEQWIAAHSRPRGYLKVDEGAARALVERGKSLLPCGIVEVDGNFKAGEIVEVAGPEGSPLGRGVTRFSAQLLRRVKGWNTREISRLVPNHPEEVIHRNDWVSSPAEAPATIQSPQEASR